jgi:hypothetical protein
MSLGPNHLLFNGCGACLAGIKRPRLEAEHTPYLLPNLRIRGGVPPAAWTSWVAQGKFTALF